MLNRHPPRHAHSHTRSHALRVTSCTSLLIVNPAERNFIFTLSHHPLLINVNQRLLHSTHCKYARPYLCWVVFFFVGLHGRWWIRAGPACRHTTLPRSHENGQTFRECSCWLAHAFPQSGHKRGVLLWFGRAAGTCQYILTAARNRHSRGTDSRGILQLTSAEPAFQSMLFRPEPNNLKYHQLPGTRLYLRCQAVPVTTTAAEVRVGKFCPENPRQVNSLSQQARAHTTHFFL